MAEENKSWLEEAIGSQVMSPEKAYQMSQNIAKARKQAEGLPLFGNGYRGNLVGGAGSAFLRTTGDALGFLNLNNAEKVLNSGADYIEERLPTPKPAAWTWDYLSSPEGWARGIGNVGGSIASIALPAGGIALKAPNLLTKAAQGLSAFTRGGIGLDTAKGLILGGLTVPTEAAMEGNEGGKAALAAGMTPEEARQKSWDVFWRNMGILGLSNTIQGGLYSKVFGKGNTLKGRLGAGAAEVGMQTEEEFLQEAAQNEAFGKPYTYNPFNLGNPKYPEQNQAALEGFMGIAPLTALGGVGGYGYHKHFGKDEEQEFEKLPAGAFEGQYWRKQHDGVKYEGAQPQTMKAIDALGKWFYEKTGAPLIVTSVTDGTSHTDGEHSHYNGWKVDVNDYGSGIEGAITTEDGKKGWLADEFIKYGQSLGLGMNWENDHIDVAVDSTQWDGLSDIKNFGGFKYSATENESESKSTPMTKEEFFAAVASQESGGDYNAENGRTGAFGKYQIMPENWASWAEEAGLSPDAPKTPENQEIIAKFKLGQYFDKYGAEGALVAWYAGEQNGQRWKDGKADAIGANGNHYSWDAPQGKGNEPSVREYVQQTLGRINSNPQNSNIESPVEENAETTAETENQRPYFVDEIIKDLFSKKIEPNFKVESQDKLTQAVYEDFVFDKLQDTDSANFFEAHPELFNQEKQFISNAKNRETVTEQFGADTINDFGQKLVADRIAAIRNIQSPTEHFTTSETTGKDNVKIFHSELAELPPKRTQKEIVNLAYRYGGTPDKKGNAFNFSNDEDRAAFMQEAENFIQNPVPSNAPPKNSKFLEEILVQDNAPTFNPFKVNPVTKNIVTQFARQKYEKRNTPEGRAEFKQNFKGMFKDGTFQNTAANREKLAEIYSDELQTFGQNELDKQIAAYQNWQQQTAQSQLETLQEKIDPARIKLEGNSRRKCCAVKKYGAEYKALGDQLQAIQAQLQTSPVQSVENIQPEQTEEQQIESLARKIFGDNGEVQTATVPIQPPTNISSEQIIEQNNSQLLRDINIGMQAISAKSSGKTREQSAQALLRVFNNPNLESMTGTRIEVPQEIQTLLGKNDSKAIQTAQQILHNATDIPLPQNAEESNAPKKIAGLDGNISTVATDNGQVHGFKYRIVDAKDLITSHELSNNQPFVNENYPQELQPRDRENRVNMGLQTVSMANKLRPNDLLDSRNVNQGAPVVRDDGVVLNGNNRTMAINEAYKIGKAEDYRRALLDNAETFGFNRADIEKMQTPVLVREITNELDQKAITEIIGSNAGGAQMSASEKAKFDVQKISRAAFENLDEDNDTTAIFDFTAEKNQPFVAQVLYDITSQNEINAYTDKKGEVNSDGIKRVKNVLSAFAYQDDDLIARMAESTDNNVKNLSEALIDVSPTMAKLQYRMNNGRLYNYDVGKNISEAVEKLSSLRDQNVKLEDYLKQQKLFDQDAPEMLEILKFFDENKLKKANVSQFLKEMASGIEAQGSPDNESEISFDFGEEYQKPQPAPLLEIIKAARDKVENPNAQSAENVQPQENIKPVQIELPPPVQNLKIQYPEGELTLNNEKATEIYKRQKGFAPKKQQEFDEGLNKQIEVGGKNMTRRELLEKMAEGEISESATKITKPEKEYLKFLRENITAPLDAIQKAGISNIRSAKKYNFTPNYIGGENLYESRVDFDTEEEFTNDTATVENIKKIAKTLGGKFGKGYLGNAAFLFGDNESANIFSKAANLFTGNEHLRYFGSQGETANNILTQETEKSLNVATKPEKSAPKIEDAPAENIRLKSGTHTHTKTGKLIPSAELTGLTDKFSELNALAQKYGGSYNKFAKKFLFKTESGRDTFVDEASHNILKTAPVETSPDVAQVKPKKRTRIFGTEEETTRDLKEAFGIVDNEENTPQSETASNEIPAGIDPDATIPADKFVNVFDDSEENIERLKLQWQKELNKTSAMPMFNPKLWTTALELGGIYLQRGINKFAAWAKQITNTLGEESKVWQPAIFEMLQSMPKIDKFSDKQITSIANKVGQLFEDGTTDFADIRADFVKNIGEENTRQIEPMIQATYNGVKKFFETLNAENKKNAIEDGQDVSQFELAEGYTTESGRNLQDADSREFIIKPDGTKDFGLINEDIAEKANAGLKSLGLEGEVKSAPIRLQVGIPDSADEDGFGYIHILPHLEEIKSKGFENIPNYIEHILKNFNQIYKGKDSDRIILYCKGEKSKGLMPLDLELEKSTNDEYYTVVTAYPRRRANKNDTLILDTRPTNVSADAATALNDPRINNNSGVHPRSGYSEENVSLNNITQNETEGNDALPKFNETKWADEKGFENYEFITNSINEVGEPVLLDKANEIANRVKNGEGYFYPNDYAEFKEKFRVLEWIAKGLSNIFDALKTEYGENAQAKFPDVQFKNFEDFIQQARKAAEMLGRPFLHKIDGAWHYGFYYDDSFGADLDLYHDFKAGQIYKDDSVIADLYKKVEAYPEVVKYLDSLIKIVRNDEVMKNNTAYSEEVQQWRDAAETLDKLRKAGLTRFLEKFLNDRFGKWASNVAKKNKISDFEFKQTGEYKTRFAKIQELIKENNEKNIPLEKYYQRVLNIIEGKKASPNSKTAKKNVSKKSDSAEFSTEENLKSFAKNESGAVAITENPAETAKAAVKVTGDEFGEYADIQELRNKAKDFYRKHLRGTSVRNPILGEVALTDDSVMFTNIGLNKMGATSAQEQKILLVKYLPELIEKADKISSKENQKDKRNASQYSYLHSSAEINGQIQDINITIFTDANGNKYYNHNIIQNEKSLPVHSAQATQESNGIPTIDKLLTENEPVNSARPESSDEALGTLPVGASSNENIPQNTENDNIERRAREALKAAGLEGKKAPEGYTPILYGYATNQAVIIETKDDKKPSATVRKNITNLAEKLNGEKFRRYILSFLFDSESEGKTFFRALQIYLGNEGEIQDVPKKYRESGRAADGHQDVQSEVRASTAEEGQETGDTATENISGQERPTLSRPEGNDTFTNAEGDRSNATNGTGSTGARNSAGNGTRGSTGVVQSELLATSPQNFRITEDNTEIGSGGLKTKFKQNIDAIKLLKQIESEGRFATPEEQKILAQFNGWGTLAKAFTNSQDWANEFQQLKELLTEEEYDAAFKAITNSFYTPPNIARAIWAGLQKLGFKGGRILDPSMGTGIFFGTMPAEFSKISELTGVELDDLTGRISKQLYQKAAIDITGFQDSPMANNYFDLVISNVPFDSDVKILSDPDYKNQKYTLHDYFFAKAMDKVRPGGFVVFITSPGTMSSFDSKKLRTAIDAKADLIAAYKLPDTTFDKNSGTKALSDILILQKRLDAGKPSEYAQEWLEEGQIEVKKDNVIRGFSANKYFEDHPENIIGTPVESTHYYGTLDIDGTGHDVAKELSELMAKLPENIYQPVQVQQQSSLQNMFKKNSDSMVKNFSFVEEDGKIYQVQGKTRKKDGELVEVPKENWATVKSYLPLMKAVINLMNAELSPETTDEKLKSLRKTLQQNYDNFVKKHGYINSAKNAEILGSDPNYGRTAAIEKYNYDKKTKSESAEKADIFFKRTMSSIQEPTTANTAKEALYIALSYKGALDLDYMQNLTGKTEGELINELGNLIFKNPETNLQELAEEYLSGNVREKLAFAQEAAKTNPEFKRNVEALQKIQPRDLTANEITTFLGASWIDNSYYEQFARRLNGGNTVSIVRNNGQFLVLGNVGDVKYTTEWRVPDTNYTLYDFLQNALNRRAMTATTNKKVDPVKTTACNNKIRELNELFNEWIWADEERAKNLVRHFNINFNNSVARKYNGEHLTLPTVAPDIRQKLYQHQKNAIWRIIQGGNTLLAHAVGAGKTFEMVIAGRELKRLGRIRKPLYVVPNNIIRQFEADTLEACPYANILVLDSKNLPLGKKTDKETPKEFAARQAKRKTTLARIATGDWDFIIISHDMFQRLPMSPHFQEQFYNEQIQELKNSLRAVNDSEDGRFGSQSAFHSKTHYAKKISTAIQKLEQQRDAAVESAIAEEGFLPFDELGIDKIFVDESDLFKNLFFKTAKENVAGISTTGSARAWDLYQKANFLNQRQNGGVVLASGTPVSNTLNEIFTLMRYLIPQNFLKQNGYSTFDEWAGLFARFIDSVELTVDGNYRLIKRCILTNLHALHQVIDEFMDYVAAEDIPNLERPKLFGGARTYVTTKATETQKKKMAEFVERMEAIHKGGFDPSEDNSLKITGESRKLAIDARLLDPTIPEEEAGGKIPAACDNIFKEYKESTAVKGAQLVFLDLGTPARNSKNTTADNQSENLDDEEDDLAEVEAITAEDLKLYDVIKQGLIKRGIPANEIAFVHDAKNADERQKLFKKVNDGEIRVILGSTQKMGAGTNFQEHLVALHHLDCPWRPRDIEQREGRILRKGNLNPEVKIFVYLTEDTLDGYNWEKIKNKQQMITSFLKGNTGLAEIEDISELSLNAVEFIAAANSNKPLAREHAKLEQELLSLKLQRSAYEQNQRAYQSQKKNLEQNISEAEKTIQQLKLDIKDRVKVETGDAFRMKIGDTVYEKRADAKTALETLMKKFQSATAIKIGEIGGFDITARTVEVYTTQGTTAKHTGYRVALQLSNHGSYTINAEKDPIQAMTNFINKGIETTLSDLEKSLEQDKTKIADIEKILKKPFEQSSELQAAEIRLKELDARIANASTEKGHYNSRGDFVTANVESFESMAEVEATAGDKNTGEQAEIAENKNSVKITVKQGKRFKTYYADGKHVSESEARKISVNQGWKELQPLFDEFVEKSGAKIVDEDKSTGAYYAEVHFITEDKLFGSAAVFDLVPRSPYFEKLEDAISCARYVHDNFDRLKIDFVAAHAREKGEGDWDNFHFSIKTTGEENIDTDAAKKAVAELGTESENISARAQKILKDLQLDNLRPNKDDGLGKTFGKLESDGSITANFDKEIDAEKLQAVKNIAQKVGGNFNSENNTFSFKNIDDIATFFKAVRTAFYGKKDKAVTENKKSPATGIELPQGYKTETGKPLNESNVQDFIVDEDGNKNFGEINSEIENATGGIIKAAPIRLQVGDEGFGFIHINLRHAAEIQNKGYTDAISYIQKILQNVNKIYSRADTGNVDRFILCSEGAKGKSKDFMPIDLELEKGEDNFYSIVTAYPNKIKKIEGILIFDDSTGSSSVTATDSLVQSTDNKSGVGDQNSANAKINTPSISEEVPAFDDSTHSSSVAATDSLPRLTDDKSGVSNHGANAKTGIPSAESVSQSENDSKNKNFEDWTDADILASGKEGLSVQTADGVINVSRNQYFYRYKITYKPDSKLSKSQRENLLERISKFTDGISRSFSLGDDTFPFSSSDFFGKGYSDEKKLEMGLAQTKDFVKELKGCIDYGVLPYLKTYKAPEVKNSLAECETTAEIEDYFNAHHKAKLQIYEAHKLNISGIKEALKGIEATIKEIPALEDALISVTFGNQFESTTFEEGSSGDRFFDQNFVIQIAGHLIKSTGLVSSKLNRNNTEQKATFLFQTGSHELGHTAHFLTTNRLGMQIDNYYGKLFASYKEGKISAEEYKKQCKTFSNSYYSVLDDLVDWAYDSMQTDKSLETLQKQISDYAARNKKETVAESVADYIIYKEKAAPLSKAVWQKLKAALETDEFINYELLSHSLEEAQKGRLDKFFGLLNNKAVMAWYSTNKNKAQNNSQLRKFAEKMLADRELASELTKINSAPEWENLLQSKIPNEKILERTGELTDEKIYEMAKIENISRAISSLGGHVENVIWYDDEKSRQAVQHFLENNLHPVSMYSLNLSGDKNIKITQIDRFLAPEDLNSKQTAISQFAKNMGVPVLFFKGNKKFHGKFSNGLIYLNVDTETSYDWVFWHENFHWLAQNNPALFKEIADAVEITQKQISDYRTETGLENLSDAEIVEEILADNMKEVASRAGLLQQVGKKNKSLVQRIISWLKSVLDKFTDFFNTPKNGLTREQKNKMYDTFGKMVRTITDENGNTIFRFNNRTKNIELANGDALPAVKFSVRDTAVTPDNELDSNGRFKNPYAARKKLQEALKPLKGIPIKNKATGIVAQFGKEAVGKLVSDKAVKKTLSNGYNEKQHYEAAMNIKQLYEDAVLTLQRPDRDNDPNIKDVKYFSCPTNVLGEDAVANIMVKNTLQHGHHIYTIELQELNKPAELKNQAANDSSAGSKGSTLNTRQDSTTIAEEPFNESIQQNTDDGNTKFSINASDNSTSALFQKIKSLMPSWAGKPTEGELYTKFIARKLKELTGYKIAYGHYLGKDAAFIDDLQKVIRAKTVDDWENLLPKVGQVLAKQLNLPATDSMHNYIASWILDGASNNNSAEAKAFQKAMRDNPATFEILRELQSKFQEINEMTPTQQMMLKIRDEVPSESLMSQILGGKAYEQLVDDLNPIKKLVQKAEERRGKNFSTTENPYELARLYKGTGGISEIMVEGENVSGVRAALSRAFPNLNFSKFKTLAAILKSIGGKKNLKEFEAYCVACNTKDLHRLNAQIFKAQQKLQAEIEELQKNPYKNKNAINAKQKQIDDLEGEIYETVKDEAACDAVIKEGFNKYGAAQKDIVNFSRTLLQMLHSSGVVNDNAYNSMLKIYPNYVPMHRVFEDNEELNFGDSMKRRKGSKRIIVSPVQTIIRNAHELIKRAERNKVKIALAGIARCGGFGDLIEEVKGKNPNDKTIITFFENGEKKFLQTAPEVVEAVNNLQTVTQGSWITNLLTAATGVLRSLYTAVSPDFAAGNFFRDMPDAYLHNKYGSQNPLTTLLATWQGLMSAFHKDKIFYEWLAMGGAQSTLVSPDRNYTQLSVDRLTKTTKERWLNSGVKGFFSQILNALQTVSEYSEYATRIGTYKLAKETLAAQNNGVATLEDMRKAALMSRDATIDFARGGRSGRTINKYVAFSNAAIQGLDRTFRTFNPAKLKTKEGRKELFGAAVRLALTGILPAIICFAMNHDKDWWQNLPNYQKENNWIFGEGVKIPKGMDFSIRLFSTLTEEFLNWTVDNRPAQLEKILERILPRKNDIISKIVPTIALPVLESSANYSWFKEAPIVPVREQNLPAHLQYGAYTSDFAKFLGEKAEISPRQIDHFISSYLGFLGKFAFSTLGTSSAGLTLENLPMVRRFVFDPYSNPQIVRDYYDKLSEQEKFYNEYKQTKKQPAGFDMKLYERFKKNKKAIQNLSKKERAILNDPRLDFDTRKKQLHDLEKIRIKICERVLK